MGLQSLSARLVPPTLAPCHPSQPAIPPDLPALADLHHGRLPGCPAVALADVIVGGDASCGVAVGAAGGTFGRDPCGLAATGSL